MALPYTGDADVIFLVVVGGEVFGYRFGGISFVDVIQMLTEAFCYHALGFTNIVRHHT